MADGGCRTPGRRVPVGYDSAGGELILGWRKSALFFKSPLSERLQDASSDFWKTLLATFQSLSSFHRRSLSRPYASSSAVHTGRLRKVNSSR